MTLGAKDCRLILKAIDDVCAADSPDEVLRASREGLASVVSGDCYDMVLFGSSEPEDDAFFAKPGTYTAEEIRFMLENVREHPLALAFLQGDPGAICLSQFVPARQWQNSMFYWESGYRRLGLKHELAALVPNVVPTSIASVSVLRARDFTPRDRAMLNHLRPHLSRAWKRALVAKPDPSPELMRRLFPVLSPKEAEVLYWITEGKQNREIADILRRSLTTVQEHVENLLRKLEMENRHALTTFALRAATHG